MMQNGQFLLMLVLVIVIEDKCPTRILKEIARDSSASLGMTETRARVYPTAAITLSSIAIGVGSAPTSIVVRVGFGLPGPAKYSP
jgi:hypothetical protein